MMTQLHRTLTLIAAVVGAAAAIVIFSRILLTLDDLQTPEIRLAYGLGVVAILAAVGALFYRRGRAARPERRPPPPPPRASIEQRLDHIYSRHGLQTDSAALSPARRHGRGEAATVALCGLPRTGKSRVATALEAALADRLKGQPLRLVETPSLGTDFAANLERLTAAIEADVCVFVADQDLRDYEFAVIKALVDRGAAPIIVINKADQRDAGARDETRAAMERRLEALLPPSDIVEAAADPLPATRIRSDAEGQPVEEQVSRPADIDQLLTRIASRLDPSSRA